MKKQKIYKSEILKKFFQTNELKYKITERKMLIANKIIDCLNEKQISKIEFSLLMKQQPSVITKWISGNHNFTIDTITEIEQKLNAKLI